MFLFLFPFPSDKLEILIVKYQKKIIKVSLGFNKAYFESD